MPTLADLFSTLESRGAFSPARVKDIKTSLHLYLAPALDAASPGQDQVDAAWLDGAPWTAALDAYFDALEAQGRTISAITRRNTRSNVRLVLREAQAHGLLTAPLPSQTVRTPGNRQAARKALAAASPYKTTYSSTRAPYGLYPAQWPDDITHGWRGYLDACGMRLRDQTIATYQQQLIFYLGYLHNVCGRAVTWEDVFDRDLVLAFVRWHAARLGRPLTVYGRRVAITIAVMAKVLAHPAHEALVTFSRSLRPAEALHEKEAHVAALSLATLDQVADACLAEGRRPLVQAGVNTYPGNFRAGCFQRGVILKLLVRIPLRQRNVREMEFRKHLTQDRAGQWHLRFRGSDLKIARRGNRENTVHHNLSTLCPDFVLILEAFLRDHRPKIPNAVGEDHVFLTYKGKPYTKDTLWAALTGEVRARTGEVFYPHLIRSIWATEYLRANPGDFKGAAYMLNDDPRTVMMTYDKPNEAVLLTRVRDFQAVATPRRG